MRCLLNIYRQYINDNNRNKTIEVKKVVKVRKAITSCETRDLTELVRLLIGK